jgi:dihydrofolate reductase
MTRTFLDITMSLDGFVAGPDATLEEPLGKGGESLHEWIFGLAGWRERHGREGGAGGPDDDVLRESIDRTGAVVMGRKMFSGGAGPWADDPKADGWWGDDPPFRAPVFVVTHHARDTVQKGGGTSYTFVTGGVEQAVEQAKAAAGGRDVHIAGGAEVAQQCLQAGLLDELQVHVAPLFLGGGARLFANLEGTGVELAQSRVIHSPAVTHLRYDVRR